MDWEELGIDKEEVEKFMKKGKDDDENKDHDSGEHGESDEVEKYSHSQS
jgi:hypothetical protein